MNLVTLRGPSNYANPLDVPPSELNDVEAGIQYMAILGAMYPEKSLSQIAASEGIPLNGLTDLRKGVTKSVGSLKDGIGDVLKDTASFFGDSTGSAVRLVTDEKVVDGAARLGTAYATQGGSEGIRSLFGGEGSTGDQVLSFLSNLGQSWKGEAAGIQAGSYGGISEKTLLWGGAGVVGLVLVLALVGRR